MRIINFLFTNMNDGNNECNVNEPMNHNHNDDVELTIIPMWIHGIIPINANVIFILSLQLIVHMEQDTIWDQESDVKLDNEDIVWH